MVSRNSLKILKLFWQFPLKYLILIYNLILKRPPESLAIYFTVTHSTTIREKPFTILKVRSYLNRIKSKSWVVSALPETDNVAHAEQEADLETAEDCRQRTVWNTLVGWLQSVGLLLRLGASWCSDDAGLAAVGAYLVL